MTEYIEETTFRNCLINNLSNPPPFISDGSDGTYNGNYNPTNNTLKILAIDDTFHDLTKDRGGAESGYDCGEFSDKGPLNYLMTGNPGFFTKEENYVSYYKNTLNSINVVGNNGYKETSGTFENKSARAFEIKHNLQPADMTITYDEIIDSFVGADFKPDFLTKIQQSNGSLTIIPSLNESTTFSNYIVDRFGDIVNDQLRNDAMLKISYFIRWYLHSLNLESSVMPTQHMRILSDAGLSFLGDIFTRPGSMITPYIAVPVFLDSAGTSTSLIDPNIPIECEELTYEEPVNLENIDKIIVPVVSNYFSCDKVFMCYIVNDRSTFGPNNFYCFSLCLLKIPDMEDTALSALAKAIYYIKNESLTINNAKYKQALELILSYIQTYPSRVARYYFGEVQKDFITNDNSYCGKCGAGVPYIGKVIKTLNNNVTKFGEVNGLFNLVTNDVGMLKNELNSLKSMPLMSRIPIADSRILKMFCSGSNEAPFAHITLDDWLLLFKLLADYKRTGDYQQSYAVLKAILKNDTNTKCYTFSSGDELSALVGRLLGVPTILQAAGSGKCVLYRCNRFMASQKDRDMLDLINSINRIKIFLGNGVANIRLISLFVSKFYGKMCALRQNLLDRTNYLAQLYLEQVKPPNLKNENIFFSIIKLLNAIYFLNDIISKCNSIKPEELNSLLKRILAFNQEITGFLKINEDTYAKIKEYVDHDLNPFIQKVETNDVFSIIDIINVRFPYLKEYIIIPELLEPLKDTTGEFKRSELDLNFKSGFAADNDIKKMVKYILSRQQPLMEEATASGRERRNNALIALALKREAAEAKQRADDKLFVYNFNSFINKIEIPDLQTEISISSYDDFFNNFQSKFLPELFKKLQEIDIKIQSQPCLKDVEVVFNEIFQRISQQTAGTININNNDNKNTIQIGQKGGATPIEKECCDKILQIVLKTFNKCNDYMNGITSYINGNNLNYRLDFLLFTNLEIRNIVFTFYKGNLSLYFNGNIDETSNYINKLLNGREIENINNPTDLKTLINNFPLPSKIMEHINSIPIPNSPSEFINPVGGFPLNTEIQNRYFSFYNFLSYIYNTDSFCDDLLYNDDYENEENLGLIPSLLQICENYTLVSGVLREANEDDVSISIWNLLYTLGLNYIFQLLYFLGWHDPDNFKIITSIYENEAEPLQTLPVNQVYNYDEASKMPFSKSIITITSLAYFNHIYYGKNSIFYLDKIIILEPIKGLKEPIIYLNWPSLRILKEGFFVLNLSVLIKMWGVLIPNIVLTTTASGLVRMGGKYKKTRRLNKKRYKIKKSKRNDKSINKNTKTKHYKKQKMHKITQRKK